MPVRGARVRVELARPGAGLGTFLGSNATRYKPGGPTGPDPLAPKAAMLRTLLEHQDPPELPVVTPTGIFRDGSDELWDDGRHRDGIADDGTYRNTYADLDKEGVYTWRFHVSGKTPDGSPFSRVATRSFWVGVGVDPAASKVDVKPLDRTRERRTVQISVLPVDAGGELLGPFRASDVQITSKDGTFLTFSSPADDGIVYPQPDKGELLSHYDGRYSRIVAYPPGKAAVATLTVQDRKFPDVVLP